MAKSFKRKVFSKQDGDAWWSIVEPFIGKGKAIELTATSDIKELKTNPQLRYLHDIIADYLVDVLVEHGNIEASSPSLAKSWVKHYCGYGEEILLKFKGVEKRQFVEASFANASKKDLSEIIESVIRVCAFGDVIIPPCKKEVKND